MSGTTTNINELPLEPSGSGSNNVNVVVQENATYNPQVPTQIPQQQPQPPQQAPPQQAHQMNTQQEPSQLDRESINNIVSGLQQASVTGATQLPSRDIPTTTTHISQDQEIQPNFIPPVKENNYIDQEIDEDDIVEEYNLKIANASAAEGLYTEMQTPIMLAILFFLFQLPFFKKYMFLYLPMFFMDDGNYNIYGYLVISIIFSLVYYLLTKSAIILNKL